MSVRDTSIDPRLLDSAREEFLRKGFIKSDLKTICDNAGVTTGAVYKRYKGKEELFSAVVSDVVRAFDSFLENRAGIDFSSLTDEDIRDSWIMNYDSMIPMFRMLRSYGDDMMHTEKEFMILAKDFRSCSTIFRIRPDSARKSYGY